jgi:hypothetical protein
MAANTAPIFPLTPVSQGLSVVSASAITARTAIVGTTGLSLCYTAGANGSRIDTIILQATGTTLAGLIDFWIYDGTTSRLIYEAVVTVVTPNTTTTVGFNMAIATTLFNGGIPLTIPTTYALYCSSQVASQLIGVVTNGGNY